MKTEGASGKAQDARSRASFPFSRSPFNLDNTWALLRYNFRVLMLNNWWLLVFPIAVSQLSVFWNVVTVDKLKMWLPAQSAERITPLLAAFLGAHLLSAEYRSRIGAVLASRPVNIGKIVVMRLGVMLAVVWGLAWLSLQAYATWLEPYDTAPVYLACIPSTLFLAMLSLTFATIFRNSLAGFGIAAIYWALDLPPGAPLNPLMSLQSLTSLYSVLDDVERRAILEPWWIAKYVLLAAAVLLYFYHSRLVFSLGSPPTNRTRRRALTLYGSVLVFYVVSGAGYKVYYGYQNRAHLAPPELKDANDITWFRYQFASYGPIPVASLFGPSFTRYLGEFNNPWRSLDEETDRVGDSPKHRQDLKEIMERTPGNPWAPSAAWAYARLEIRKQANVDAAVALYRKIVDKFPTSPYTDSALREMAIRYIAANRLPEARAAYDEMLRRVPDSRFRAEAEKPITSH